MNVSPIFLPFFTMFVLTFFVWVYMYARRIPFIVTNQLTPEQMTPIAFIKFAPPSVSNPSDNLRNLFELPVLFYAVVLYLHVTGNVDDSHVFAAWVFVAFRVLHSLVHCTINIVLLRFWLYVISATALWIMVLRAAATLF
jgi:hypothetical protein